MVPAHFEQDTIGETLLGLHKAVRVPFQALVVYDRADDPTADVFSAGQVNWPEASLLRNAYGRGALNAIRTGLEAAQTEYVAVFMADMSDGPEILNAMLAAADAGADVVSASRYMKGGSQTGGPWFKAFLSRNAGRSLHWLTRIPTRDPTNSVRLYRTSFLRQVEIQSVGGFEVGIELTVKAYVGGWQVAEVPSHWHDRSAGESKFELRNWLPQYLRWYFYALFRAPLGIRLARRKR